jgi:Zn-dependent protease
VSSPDDGSPNRARQPGLFRLGTVAGIDITVATSWFVILALIAFLMAPRLEDIRPGLGGWAYVAGAAYAVLLYMSVLLHEISHALAALAFKMKVNSINLHFLGGATEIEGEAETPWREFVIAVVGPLTSIALGAVGWFCVDLFDEGLIRFSVASLSVANLIVGVLNLVPGLPLDGGRVLQSAVWAITRRRSLGVTAAAWGGRIAAVALMGLPLIVLPALGYEVTLIDYVLTFMISAFLWAGATHALAVTKIRSRLPALQARTLARPAIGVPADLPVAEAIRRAQEARAGSVVVLTADGRPTGIVNEDAVRSTPEERRPWLPVGDLARRLEAGLYLGVDMSGEALLKAMNATPATEYVVLHPDGSIYGVLVSKDVDAAFKAA